MSSSNGMNKRGTKRPHSNITQPNKVNAPPPVASSSSAAAAARTNLSQTSNSNIENSDYYTNPKEYNLYQAPLGFPRPTKLARVLLEPVISSSVYLGELIAGKVKAVNWKGVARVSTQAAGGVLSGLSSFALETIKSTAQKVKGGVRAWYCSNFRSADIQVDTVSKVLKAYQQENINIYYKPRARLVKALESKKLTSVQKERIQRYIDSGKVIAKLFVRWIVAVAARERLQSIKSSLTTAESARQPTIFLADNAIFEAYHYYKLFSQIRADELAEIDFNITTSGVNDTNYESNVSNIGAQITPEGETEDMSFKAMFNSAIISAAYRTMYGILSELDPTNKKDRERLDFIKTKYGITAPAGQHVQIDYNFSIEKSPSFSDFTGLMSKYITSTYITGKSIDAELREIVPLVLQNIQEPVLTLAGGPAAVESCPRISAAPAPSAPTATNASSSSAANVSSSSTAASIAAALNNIGVGMSSEEAAAARPVTKKGKTRKGRGRGKSTQSEELDSMPTLFFNASGQETIEGAATYKKVGDEWYELESPALGTWNKLNSQPEWRTNANNGMSSNTAPGVTEGGRRKMKKTRKRHVVHKKRKTLRRVKHRRH